MNSDPAKNPRPVSTPTEALRRQVPREEIAQRAEQLWRERNCPVGCDDTIWLQAESELQAKAESRPVSGTESRPYIDEPAKPLRTNTKSRDPAEAGGQTRSATEGKAQIPTRKLRNQ